MYQEIFKQGKIGNITLKNRLVMSPMGTSLAEMDGSPSEDMIAFYAYYSGDCKGKRSAWCRDDASAVCFKRQTYRRSCKACRNST